MSPIILTWAVFILISAAVAILLKLALKKLWQQILAFLIYLTLILVLLFFSNPIVFLTGDVYLAWQFFVIYLFIYASVIIVGGLYTVFSYLIDKTDK